MNAPVLLFLVVVIVGSTTAQFYGDGPYSQYGYGPYGYGNRPYRPYRPGYGGGYRPHRPGHYGGYRPDHYHQGLGEYAPYPYPGEVGIAPQAAGGQQPAFAPAAPAPAAVPSGALAPGSANAGGAGNGAVQNGQAVGTGTGIANAGPGGFGIGLGIGLAVATPLGNIALGEGNSVSVGK